MKHQRLDPKSIEVVNAAIGATNQSMKKYATLRPIFFIGNWHTIDVEVVELNQSNRYLDEVAERIKKKARQIGADFILSITEAWAVRPEFAQDFADNPDQYPNVSDHPHKKRVVTFLLETTGGGSYLGLADILEGRELGEVSWLKGEPTPARFTHLLEAEGGE